MLGTDNMQQELPAARSANRLEVGDMVSVDPPLSCNGDSAFQDRDE